MNDSITECQWMWGFDVEVNRGMVIVRNYDMVRRDLKLTTPLRAI